MVALAADHRTVHGATCRPGAFRRHSGAASAQPGGQPAPDRRPVLRRQRRALRLSDDARLRRLLPAIRGDATVRPGAVRPQARESQGTPGGGWLPERLQLQSAVLHMQPDPPRPGSASGRLLRRSRRRAGARAHGVRLLSVDHDNAQSRPRVSAQQRPHHADHQSAQEFRDRPDVESIDVGPTPTSTAESGSCTSSATRRFASRWSRT